MADLIAIGEGWEIGQLELIAPADDANYVSIPPTFDWSPDGGANIYNLQVATDPGFSSIVVDLWTVETSYEANEIQYETSYYWRVRAAI